MRHRKKGRKFGRVRKTRRAFIRSLIRSLAEHGKIETTLARAKAVRPLAEKLVTKAKKGGLPARRAIARLLNPKQASKIYKIASSLKDRRGGYIRIIRTKFRNHDKAEMAVLEFLKQ